MWPDFKLDHWNWLYQHLPLSGSPLRIGRQNTGGAHRKAASLTESLDLPQRGQAYQRKARPKRGRASHREAGNFTERLGLSQTSNRNTTVSNTEARPLKVCLVVLYFGHEPLTELHCLESWYQICVKVFTWIWVYWINPVILFKMFASQIVLSFDAISTFIAFW